MEKSTDIPKDPRRFEMAALWSIVKLSPLFVLFAYVAGYIVDMSYLSTIGIHYIRLVNSTFLSAGILVVGIFSPVVYSVYSNFQNPTDNASLNYKQWPGILRVSIPWSVLIAIGITADPSGKSQGFLNVPLTRNVFLLSFSLQFLVTFYVSSYAARNLSFRLSSWLVVVTSLILLAVTLVLAGQSTRILLFLFVGVIMMSHIFIGTYGDKKLAAVGPIIAILMFLGVCFYFGKSVYGYVPHSIGGMRPYSTTLIISTNFRRTAVELGLLGGTSSEISDAMVVFEDSDSVAFRLHGNTYLFGRSMFVGEIAHQ